MIRIGRRGCIIQPRDLGFLPPGRGFSGTGSTGVSRTCLRRAARGYLSRMDRSSDSRFPWRPAILGPLTVSLFGLALYFYNNLQPEIGLVLLGVTFAIPMVWVILAAREAEHGDSPVREFIPRISSMLVLGSSFLGYSMWSVDRRITALEACFVAFYVAAAFTAIRILDGKPKRPQLTALSGGNIERRRRRQR